MTATRSGVLAVVGATAAAGVIAYVITWLVPASIGGAAYAPFAVFWSALYLAVGALSGIQQEMTRGTRRRTASETTARVSRARNFGVIAAVVTALLVVATAPLWSGRVFPGQGTAMAWPVAVGIGGYVGVATLAGTLFGLAELRAAALLTALDSFLRLVSVLVVLALTDDTVALAWAVALPFPLALVIGWPLVRSRVVGRSDLDVGYRRLLANVARTVIASASASAIVSGYPLLLSIAEPRADPALLATVFLSVTLTRAPLIVSLQAMQGVLIVRFRDGDGVARQLRRISAAVVAVGAVLATAAAVLGPPVFSALFPDEVVLGGALFATLVLSSALVALMFVVASAALARGRHLQYSAGWATAAGASIVALLVPLDLIDKVILSLIAGPAAGLAVLVFGLAIMTRGIARPAG